MADLSAELKQHLESQSWQVRPRRRRASCATRAGMRLSAWCWAAARAGIEGDPRSALTLARASLPAAQEVHALLSGPGPEGSAQLGAPLRLRGGCASPLQLAAAVLRLRGGAGSEGAAPEPEPAAAAAAPAAAPAAPAAAPASAGPKPKRQYNRRSAEELAAAKATAAASGKHKFKVGESVEVMNDEEGLTGCWCAACPPAVPPPARP